MKLPKPALETHESLPFSLPKFHGLDKLFFHGTSPSKARPEPSWLNSRAPQFPRPRIFGGLSLRTTLRARHIDTDPPIASSSSSGSRRRPSLPGRGRLHPELLLLVRAPRLSLTDLYVVLFLSHANPQVQIFRCGGRIFRSIRPVLLSRIRLPRGGASVVVFVLQSQNRLGWNLIPHAKPAAC
jgi:hypothetical protein